MLEQKQLIEIKIGSSLDVLRMRLAGLENVERYFEDQIDRHNPYVSTDLSRQIDRQLPLIREGIDELYKEWYDHPLELPNWAESTRSKISGAFGWISKRFNHRTKKQKGVI